MKRVWGVVAMVNNTINRQHRKLPVRSGGAIFLLILLAGGLFIEIIDIAATNKTAKMIVAPLGKLWPGGFMLVFWFYGLTFSFCQLRMFIKTLPCPRLVWVAYFLPLLSFGMLAVILSVTYGK